MDSKKEEFCVLYASGPAMFAGNAKKCYETVYVVSDRDAAIQSDKLLKDPEVIERIKEIDATMLENNGAMRKFLTSNLMQIVERCSIDEYRDRRGTLLSPAPLRAVAVNAMKSLMDLYPVKQASEHKVELSGASENGIVFNVIVPTSEKEKDNEA